MTGLFSSGAYNGSDVGFVNREYINWKDASGDQTGLFPSHERSHFHRHCMAILTKSHCDIVDMMSSEHEKQKAVNRAYLSK